ncbi:MAG: RNA-binding protein, partial [Caldiserica bacterium]
VEMATEDQAEKALQSLNNTQLDGRNIRVAEARPREEKRRFKKRRNIW